MSENIDLTQAMSEAEARRQATANAEAEAQKARRSELVGDLLLDVQATANDPALDHDSKVSRLQAAIEAVNGRSGVAPAPAPVAASAASTVPFDYASLPEAARQIIDLVAAEPGRFKIEEFGGVRDKAFGRLREAHRAEQAPAADQEDSSADKTSAPAPVKKSASPNKAAGKEPEAGAEKRPGIMQRAKAAGKAALDNAKQ